MLTFQRYLVFPFTQAHAYIFVFLHRMTCLSLSLSLFLPPFVLVFSPSVTFSQLQILALLITLTS